jgi:hypothetical protein
MRQQDVVRGRAHHLRFVQLCDGEADGAATHLFRTEFGGLVRLGMRPQREPVLRSVRRHAVEI